MFVGQVLDETTDVLATMKASPFMFYLTGSRFFGTATKDSDWDFFAQESAGIVEWLDVMDFKPLNKTMYDDDNTALVFRLSNIDVQLQRNAALKHTVQEYIKESGLLGVYLKELSHPAASKSYAKRIWNLAYRHFA